MNFLLLVAALAASLQMASASSCSSFPQGYYASGSRRSGAPPSTSTYSYTLKPDFLSCGDLQRLNEYCVSRINQYRSGQLKFTGGSSDSALGSPAPLSEAVGNRQCQAEITMGDFAMMGNGGCGAGAHKNAWGCSAMGGSQGQNSCCPRSAGNSYSSVAAALDGCLQQMWDEGLGGSTTGHWLIMKSTSYSLASCGFAFGKASDGSNTVLMSQNFAGSFNGVSAPTAPPAPATTKAPTKAPVAAVTKTPTKAPVAVVTKAPVAVVTKAPVAAVTKTPTKAPVAAPVALVTKAPTKTPTVAPAAPPVAVVTKPPTKNPTNAPVAVTTQKPTDAPTIAKTQAPTYARQTRRPTSRPTLRPFARQTRRPTSHPTRRPHRRTAYHQRHD
ncbi:hypothetical protein BASA81_004730 [Batrachochytrium salamandrivorans]|nr:hypothetical protein BASA81_004730 [Batrachochytrium salamandrivorans]